MFEVGQKLWFVRREKRSGVPVEVTVEKVGRIWTTLSNRMRCSSSGLVDGGQYTSPGFCYVSREAYEEIVKLNHEWYLFQRDLAKYGTPPAGMNVNIILEARHILLI